MPVPLILAGLAVAGAALGIGAQLDAKQTNELAQQVVDEAKSLYESSKNSLEIAKAKTEKSLLHLGNSKKRVLDTSINQFLIAYACIKNIELSESVGFDEIKKFTLEEQDVIQLREMSNIYQSTFSSGAAGATTGAVIALAASGSLPVVTSGLSIAGTALVAGEIGAAASIAGSALSFGVAMTPLAAIAAPAVLFSGISASLKADENLEKAHTMYAEAEAAAEQMKTSEVLCVGIADRADMFDDLLGELNGMFSYCTALLDGVTKKKMGFFKNRIVDARTFSEDELKLVAVTRSLAGAIKAVIDTPILTAEGAISNESKNVYDDTQKRLPAFTKSVGEVKEATYTAKPIILKSPKIKQGKKSNLVLRILKIILGVFAGFFALLILGAILSMGNDYTQQNNLNHTGTTTQNSDLNKEKEVESIRQMTLSGSEYPLGQLIDNFMSSPTYELYDPAEDGNTYVKVKGSVVYGEQSVMAALKYKKTDNGDYEFYALTFDNIPQDDFIVNSLFQSMEESFDEKFGKKHEQVDNSTKQLSEQETYVNNEQSNGQNDYPNGMEGDPPTEEYLLMNSDSAYLTQEEVDIILEMGDKDWVRLAINELYARHGFIFKKAENRDYFASMSWYQPVEGLTDEYVKTELFNPYEKENLKTLLSIEEELNYAQ